MRSIRAFLWGGAIGALLGILFAPQTGEETRAQLQARISDLQGQAQTQMDTLRSRSSGLVEQGRQTANNMLNQAQRGTNTAADKAQDTIAKSGTTNY
ncbi:MAG TPA: YtxH domain-containing protein [Ktedonobacterales bacterium]|jgi:gas vesicle protein